MIGTLSVPPAQYLVLGGMLFSIGTLGFLSRRNALIMFMSIELMLNGVNLTLVTFARMHGNLDGQILAFFVIVVAAAEAIVGLAILVGLYRRRRTVSVDDVSGMRG